MHNLKHILLAISLGLLLGFFTAWFALEQRWGFDRVVLGPWVGEPRAGALDSDPYSRALLVQKAFIPLGGGEGVAFTARHDSEGRSLTARCAYVIKGMPLPTRWWTLHASDASGALFDNPLRRSGFTSQEVLRQPNGEFHIHAAHQVTSGNWIPLPADGPLRFVLRFYDTPHTTAAGLAEHELPKIMRESCE